MRRMLVLVLLAAACTGPADSPVERAAHKDGGSEFGPEVQVWPPLNNQVEAVVSVSEDGRTVLTCAHGLFSIPSPGFASTDGGQSWTRPAYPPGVAPGGDCETALTPAGVWAFLASTVAGATILVTEDQGESWTVNPLSALPVNGLADRPWLIARGEELWLTYMPLNQQPGQVGFTRSTDYGRSWSEPVLIGELGPETLTVRHSHPVITARGVELAMIRAPEGLGVADEARLELAWSADGVDWSVETVLTAGHISRIWPALAYTGGGDTVVGYASDGRDGRRLRLLRRRNGGDWTAIDTELLRGVGWPFLAGGPGDEIAFLAEGDAGDGDPGLYIGRYALDSGVLELYRPQAQGGIEFGSVAYDGNGDLHASWTLGGGLISISGVSFAGGTFYVRTGS